MKAPGQVTVGIDKTGKHYMYVAGGGRGRHALNLNKKQSEGLARMGLRPGGEIKIGSGVAAALGISGGSPTPAGATSSAGKAVAQKRSNPNSAAMRSVISKMLASHSAWVKSPGVKGKTATMQRLNQLFARGRADWLKQGNVSEAHKAFAATVLGTIFNKGVKANSGNVGKFKVTFNPGGEQGGGHITLKNAEGQQLAKVEFDDITKIKPSDIEHIRNAFGKERGSGQQLGETSQATSSDSSTAKSPEAKKADEVNAIKKVFQAAGIKPSGGNGKTTPGSVEAPKKRPFGTVRNFKAGPYTGSIGFENETHRDLYDLGSKSVRKGMLTGNQASRSGQASFRNIGDVEGRTKTLAKKLGMSEHETLMHARDVYNDAKAQMKGIKDDEHREVKYKAPEKKPAASTGKTDEERRLAYIAGQNRKNAVAPEKYKAPEKKEQLTGGKGDNKPDSAFEPKALAKGAKMEGKNPDKHPDKVSGSDEERRLSYLAGQNRANAVAPAKMKAPESAKADIDEALMFQPPEGTFKGKVKDYNDEYMSLMNDPKTAVVSYNAKGEYSTPADKALHEWQKDVAKNPQAEPTKYLELKHGRKTALEHFDRMNHARKQYYGYVDKNQRFEDVHKGYGDTIDAPAKPAIEKSTSNVKPTKAPKVKKEKPATAVKEVKNVATQIALGGPNLHPLAASLRERKGEIQKISEKGHKKLIETYNQHVAKGHKAAMNEVWKQVDRITQYHDQKRSAEAPKKAKKSK
jgi:hypothetical protein